MADFSLALSLWFVSAGALGVVFLLIWATQQIRENSAIAKGLDLIALKIELPIQIAAPDQARQRLREFLNLLHGLFANKRSFGNLFSGEPAVSLEIVFSKNKAEFYLYVPRQWQAKLSRYIYAPFPEAELKTAGTVAIFKPEDQAEVSLLLSRAEAYLPVVTLADEQALGGFVREMTELSEGAKISLQLTLTGLSEQWNSRALSETSRFSPEEAAQLRHKASDLQFAGNIRLMSAASSKSEAQRLQAKALKLLQKRIFRQERIKIQQISPHKYLFDFIYRVHNRGEQTVLSVEELSALWPFGLVGKDQDSPALLKPEASAQKKWEIVDFQTLYDKLGPVRSYHFYTVGGTGTGKTTLLAKLALKDISQGKGAVFIDPHGDLIDKILGNLPKDRLEDVIYFDASQKSHRLRLNLLEPFDSGQKHLLVQEILGIFRKMFPAELVGPVFEHNMRNIFLTLMADEQSPGTLVEVPKMLTDRRFAKRYINKLQDELVRDFWDKEQELINEFHRSESLQYLISKLGRFIEDPIMRQVLGRPHSSFSFGELIKNKQILFANLAKGRLGELNSQLLGLILVSKLRLAAFAQELSNPVEVNLYVDEFHNFITKDFSNALSESRKFGLRLHLANQFLGQLDRLTLQAVLGNVGTIAVFRLGLEDAKELAPLFSGAVKPEELLELSNYEFLVRSLRQEQKISIFQSKTEPLPPADRSVSLTAKRLSALRFAVATNN